MTVHRAGPAFPRGGSGGLRTVGPGGPALVAAAPIEQTAADAFAARTVQILRRAGVQAIVLDGRSSLPAQVRRSRGAVDILVAPWALDSATLLLRHHGYGCKLQGVRDGGHPRDVSAWSAAGHPGLRLDLYSGFPGVDDPERFFSGMWRSRRLITSGEVQLPVPGAAGAALILLLRAAAAGESGDGTVDLGSAVGLHASVWAEVGTLAVQSDARQAVTAGVALLPAGAGPLVMADGPSVPSGRRVLRAVTRRVIQHMSPERAVRSAGPAQVARSILPRMRPTSLR